MEYPTHCSFMTCVPFTRMATRIHAISFSTPDTLEGTTHN